MNAACLLLLAVVCGLGRAQAQSDNFNDGNDNGWCRVDQLGDLGLGGFASWTVTNGTYVLRCDAPPVPDAGPGRAGSLWTNAPYLYTNFFVSVQVMDIAKTTNAAIGILARVQDPINYGVTAGYALTYEPRWGDFQISVLPGDGSYSLLIATNLTLPPTNTYQFEFLGRGDYLEARVSLAATPNQPLAVISITEPTFPSGWCGLLVFNSSMDLFSSPVQATFDNYAAKAEEPPSLSVQLNGSQAEVSWPAWAWAYQLQRTTNMAPASWSAVASGIVSNANGFLYSTPATNRSFFRLFRN